MKQELILLPMIALVLLTAIVWVWLYLTRVGTIRRQRIPPQALATRALGAALLAEVAGPSDNLMNLFEMPVLFYILTILLYVTGLAGTGHPVLASVYVALRYAHSVIHITYNRVLHRFLVYVASCAVLWAMWAWFTLQIFERARVGI